MKKLKTLLFNQWTVGIFLLLLFALLVILIGPLISIGESRPLASSAAQWITIVAVIMLWVIKKLVGMLLEKKKQNEMIGDMVNAEENANEDFNKEELLVLQDRFKNAVQLLNQSTGKFKKKVSLYSLPWYIIIGPPGSGKTTALLNSGLKFPLANDKGNQAIEGVGGTRNCDWWFTDQAVMIDTAGRYITQDSNKDVDSTGWLNFLGLLKRYRKRQPINGAFIAISASDLLVQSPRHRQQHVAAIKQRIQELHTQLGIHFPIYVIVTKSDLISGFDEFFSDLDKEDRKQVWGMTFDLNNQNSQEAVASFNNEFDLLVRRLNEQAVHRINREMDVQKRAAINSFSKQMQVIQGVLHEFLADIFENTRYDQDAMLRGVYLTSGTQEGTPIDRLVNRLGHNTNMTARGVGSSGKSYFISDLLLKVAFAESAIAGVNLKLEKRLTWMRRLGVMTAVAALVSAAGVWASSYFYNENYIQSVEQQLATAQKQAEGLSRYDTDPISALALLNTLKGAAAPPVDEQEAVLEEEGEALNEFPWYSHFGLSQAEKLTQQTDSAYNKALKKAFYARLILKLEDILKQNNTPLSLQYIALRTYLMLDSTEHYKAEDVTAFFTEVWLRSNSASLTPQQQQELSEHIQTLFVERPLPLPVALDQRLIDKTRLSLQSISFDEQIYARVQQRNFSQHKGFSIYDAAGRSLAELVFMRNSGRSLSEGLSPLYTKAVYKELVSGGFEETAESVLGEAWVYGENNPSVRTMDRQDIIEKVKMRYLHDYRKQYQNLLADIEVLPFSSFEEARRVLDVLAGENSPMVKLVEGVTEQTRLTGGNVSIPESSAVGESIKEAQENISRFLGNSMADSLNSVTQQKKDIVTEAFSDLHEMVEKDDAGNSPMLTMMGDFEELKKIMSAIAFESVDGAVPPALAGKVSAAVTRLKYVSESQPDSVVKPVIEAVVERSSSLSQGGIVSHLNQLWKDEVLGFCTTAIKGRYPVVRSSFNDIQMGDFARFFGYGGMMDSFFQQHLRKYVDISSSPWKTRSSQTAPVALSSSALRAFEKAAEIRKAFFKFGSDQPNFSFSLKPENMDPSINQFNLNVAGQNVTYEHGPLLTDKLKWPGPSGDQGVRLVMKHLDGNTSVLNEEGEWAWLRLLDKIDMQKTSRAEKFDLTFVADGYQASYEMTAGASNNPYRIMKKMQFRCPTQL